jgi:hypothetical protein
MIPCGRAAISTIAALALFLSCRAAFQRTTGGAIFLAAPLLRSGLLAALATVVAAPTSLSMLKLPDNVFESRPVGSSPWMLNAVNSSVTWHPCSAATSMA